MAIDIKLRLYDFPSHVGNGPQSLICKDMDIDGTSLTEKVAKQFNVSTDRLSLVFCGRHIKPTTRLKATGFRSGHLIQVLYKALKKETSLPDVDAKRLQRTMAGLHVIFCGRRQDHKRLKKNVMKVLTDSKRMQKIIDSVPGLNSEPIILDILRHPDVFGHVVAPTNCSRILSYNKRLGAAILLVWESTPATKSLKIEQLFTSMNNRGIASDLLRRQVLDDDDNDDDEDDDDEEMDYNLSQPSTSNLPATQQTPSRLITSNQLAQALSIATNPTTTGNTRNPQNAASSESNNSASTVITPNAFSMAMQQALARPSNQPSQQQQQPNPSNNTPINAEVMKKGLEQLVAMGITDERASKEALLAANGDVEIAINILFSSGVNNS